MYNKYAKEYDAVAQVHECNAKFQRPSLLSLLPDMNSRKVLDLVCGPGADAKELVARGAIVTAADVSQTRLSLTRSKLGVHQTVYVQDLAVGIANEKAASFDVTICPLAIHYLKDIRVQ